MGVEPKMLGKTAGLARVVAEVPVSDGTTAVDVHGFFVRESGVLDSTFRLAPLVPNQWRGAAQPEPFTRGVLGMHYALVRGTIPELLVLTPGALTSGSVWRFAPWGRADGGTAPGLEEAREYHGDGTSGVSPSAGAVFRNAPSFAAHGGRVYFTFGDGGPLRVWDRWGNRVRLAGFASAPAAPGASGPMRESTSSPNSGGFSARGRIGTTDSTFTDGGGISVGGVDKTVRMYAVVWENVAGGYSPTSEPGGLVSVQLQLADPTTSSNLEQLTRRFRVHSIPKGPDGTAAVVLLATANLARLPPGDDGSMHFLVRLPSNEVQEWIDDVPDGELGARWRHRAPFPPRADVVASFGGSLWIFSGSRAYWTEQEEAGPIFESILAAHWQEVYPSTGEVTAALPLRGLGNTATPLLLVLKAEAAHYVAGAYPEWSFGTLHPRAGCAGAQLVQATPDGAVVWYGTGTFWRADADDPVPKDIGAPIRRRLRRVNTLRARYGCSWVDRRAGEAVFALPLDDDTLNGWQFVWDYVAGGWRTRRDVKVRAAAVVGDLVLLAGEYGGVDTVWVYGRGYPGFAVAVPTAFYTTGWTTYSDGGPEMHASFHTSDIAVVLEERGNGTAAVEVFQDWSFDATSATLDSDVLPLAHPEDSGIPYFGVAVYGVDVWRTRRYASSRVVVDIPHHEVAAAKVSGTSPMALVSLDFYGQLKAPPLGHTPMKGHSSAS